MECVHAIVYDEGGPQRCQYSEVASPPRDAISIKSLPGLSNNHLLRDIKGGTVEQVYLIPNEVVTAPNEEQMSDLGEVNQIQRVKNDLRYSYGGL